MRKIDYFDMTSDSGEFEDIIRVIEGVRCAKGPKGCKMCADLGIQNNLCLIRIYKEASEEPRLLIELDREDQQYFTYDVLKCFDNIPQARDYAHEHEVWDVEY
ncbi:MAG: hypothetical protein KGD60_04515 [Candidatus Thorarchaeota archaeon]|nr:hypothetical protein [Candidatus Thorarchaeota archaeon]